MSCIYIKTLQEEDQYNTRSKRVNYALFYCLGGRLVSMQNFRLIVPLFTWLWPALYCFVRTISKTGSKRVNDELHKCALPRMKTGLLEFIDATVIASS